MRIVCLPTAETSPEICCFQAKLNRRRLSPFNPHIYPQLNNLCMHSFRPSGSPAVVASGKERLSLNACLPACIFKQRAFPILCEKRRNLPIFSLGGVERRRSREEKKRDTETRANERTYRLAHTHTLTHTHTHRRTDNSEIRFGTLIDRRRRRRNRVVFSLASSFRS